ncbi:EAL domain-containing protein [Paraburkholderia sp. UCT31]|uniref:EAL domain-containing protein n=1 Tax=Paraburkholderia sp. UCT31 TaxID=2615209 RepID=UPI001655F354|nr:EAL domain-containing protein [Paraburkholderia sp. UCT31]MBC8739753.1 EAL domain-containing protein [Paraburkholderia sp. UCT31]
MSTLSRDYLFQKLDTGEVRWRVYANELMLHLFGRSGDWQQTVALTGEQFESVSRFGISTSVCSLRVESPEGTLNILLVGRQREPGVWGGTATIASESVKAVVRELRHSLALAKRGALPIRLPAIVGKANSLQLWGRFVPARHGSARATRDALTGLPNRAAAHPRLELALKSAPERRFALLQIGLDNFKRVNEHFGHDAGDRVLQGVSAALKACVGESAMLARIGGDEFIVLAEVDEQYTGLEGLANRLIEALGEPFDIGETKLYTGCSIGIAVSPQHGTTREELARHADMALDAAKCAGKNTYRLFTAEMDDRVSEYVWLDQNLRKSLENPAFELHFQPKISLRNGAVESVEALVRWNSPEKGLLRPDSFIPYAEETGLIVPLGKWALNAAARQARIWKDAGQPLRVGVNLSGRQLRDPRLFADFERALALNDFSESPLDIELTESWLIEDQACALELIEKFHSRGAQVHLDDFGTGYSSLSRLAQLPLDALKMDRSFIDTVQSDVRAQALVRSIATVAKELNIAVIAEGVETAEQGKFLEHIGVEYAQGYLYARPMTAKRFEKWLAAWKTDKPS